jgi:hypothetical protein
VADARIKFITLQKYFESCRRLVQSFTADIISVVVLLVGFMKRVCSSSSIKPLGKDVPKRQLQSGQQVDLL